MELNTNDLATLIKNFLKPIVLEIVEEEMRRDDNQNPISDHIRAIAEFAAEKEMENHNDAHDHQAMENSLDALSNKMEDFEGVDSDAVRDILVDLLSDVEVEATLRLR